MRTSNINYTVDGTLRSGNIEYPDLWCFAFNPNYVVIRLDDAKANGELSIVLSTVEKSYEITVSLYRGTAKVFISKILQILFDDIEHVRTANVSMSLRDNGVEMLSTPIEFISIWGGIHIGEQFGKYGAFVYNGKNISHVRNVVWFRNFPFYVSMFRAERGELMSARYDNMSGMGLQLLRYSITSTDNGELPSFESSKNEVVDGVVLNTRKGLFYAYKRTSDAEMKYYKVWKNGGSFGSSEEYNTANGLARDDVEFSLDGSIVRWNSYSEKLEYATMGNASDNGIFELNPAITFSDAKRMAEYNICIEKVTSGIFNMNFNFPFPDVTKIVNETVRIHISDKKDGLYMRWIDRFGFIQYYLFIEGKSTIKAKASSDIVQVERTYEGMNFGGLERPVEVTNTETRKCSAVNLPKDILEYVKTIVNASVVELYCGKNKGGTELWLPIYVADGSYSTDPKTQLSDYEISVKMPTYNSQTL